MYSIQCPKCKSIIHPSASSRTLQAIPAKLMVAHDRMTSPHLSQETGYIALQMTYGPRAAGGREALQTNIRQSQYCQKNGILISSR